MERKEFFLSELDKYFANKGFEFRKSKKQFVKKTDRYTVIYGFDFSEYFYMYESVIKIEIHEVEKIKKAAWGKLYKNLKLASVGQVKTYIIKDRNAHLIVTDTEQKVLEAIEKEKFFYENYVLDYILNMTDIQYLNQLLNKEPGKELFITFNPIHTLFLAIIVAKLTTNPNFEFLVKEYRLLILKHNQHFIEEYEMLVAYLSA